jgi:hypothetical protein
VGSCVAVGFYTFANPGRAGLIETLSDGSWTATEAPQPTSTATSPYNTLEAVACPAVGSCVATGQYAAAPEDVDQAVVETLSDGTWTGIEAPLPANASTSTVDNQTVLDGVACPALGSCEAVGSYSPTGSNPAALIETLADGTWTPVEGPAPTGDEYGAASTLQFLSCPISGSCIALGQYPTTAGSRALIETLTGGTWTIAEPTLPSNSTKPTGIWNALSCPTASSCVAIGTYTGLQSSQEGLIETLPGATSPPPFTSTTTVKPVNPTISLGQSNTVVATVRGNATDGSPTGTVTFYECGPTSVATPCAFQSNPVGSSVSVTPGAGNSSNATSVSFTPPGGGYWCFAAYYSGDANYSASLDSTDGCFLIPRTATSTIAGSSASSLLFGQTETALATVNGTATHGSPSGTVQFFDCESAVPAPCSSLNDALGAPVSLSAGTGNTATATSLPFVPSYGYVGYWCIAAYYSGDAYYAPSSGGVSAAAGCVYDTSLTQSIVTSVPTLSTISLGQSVADVSTVTGNTTYGSPTGALSFDMCGPSVTPTSCYSASEPVGNPVGLTATGPTTSTATSSPFTPDALGYWCFQADYFGGGSYTTVYDQTTDGCVNVVALPPVVTSTAQASAVAKKPFSFTITATGAPAPTITASGLPKWLVLTANGNGAATLHASKAHKGEHKFTVIATSGASSTQQVFTLTVTAKGS